MSSKQTDLIVVILIIVYVVVVFTNVSFEAEIDEYKIYLLIVELVILTLF
jgi:hypothetical protein